MLKKVLAAVLMLPVMCCTVYADVMYLSENESGDSIYRLTADTAGKFQSDLLYKVPASIEGLSSGMRIFTVNGRELLLDFGSINSGDDNFSTIISVYETSNLSDPIASRTFTDFESFGNAAVWGNHILLACPQNTIIELDPFTCSVTQRYTYDEHLPEWVAQETGINIPDVSVFNGKIYALLWKYDYPGKGEESANSASFTAADSSGVSAVPYFVEMSSLGTITREINETIMPELAGFAEFGDESVFHTTAGGKLYVFSSRLRPHTNPLKSDYVHGFDRAIYCFDGEISAASARKIVLPDGVHVPKDTFQICADGNGGVYFSALKYSGKKDSYGQDVADETAIYHYDGSAVREVYSANTFNGMVYDKSGDIITIIVPYYTGEQLTYDDIVNDLPEELPVSEELPRDIVIDVTSCKLVVLRPSSSGNLSVVKEIDDVYWCGITQSTYTQPDPAPSAGNGNSNPPSSNPPSGSNPGSGTQINTPPQDSTPPSYSNPPSSNPPSGSNPPYHNDPYGYDDGDGAAEKSDGGGGCNAGFGVIVFAASAVTAMLKKGR